MLDLLSKISFSGPVPNHIFESIIHAYFKQKPHDAWTVICKGLPTWKAEWKDRPSNDCFFCPPAFKQDKGARVVDQWTDNAGVVKG